MASELHFLGEGRASALTIARNGAAVRHRSARYRANTALPWRAMVGAKSRRDGAFTPIGALMGTGFGRGRLAGRATLKLGMHRRHSPPVERTCGLPSGPAQISVHGNPRKRDAGGVACFAEPHGRRLARVPELFHTRSSLMGAMVSRVMESRRAPAPDRMTLPVSAKASLRDALPGSTAFA